MEQLVFKGENDQAMTNSLLVAQKFEKEHKNVIRDIQNLVAQNSAAKLLFVESEYENRGKMYPMYIMNRDGFSLLVMGFNGAKALNFKLDFMNSFNEMEKMLKSDDYIIMRSMQIMQAKIESTQQQMQMLQGTVDVQEQQIKTLAPKATYTDEVLQSTSTYTLTQVAHDLGMRSVYQLTAWLKEKGILFYQSRQWQPTAKVAGKHYFATRTAKYIKDGEVCSSLSTVITELGRAWLHSLLNNERRTAI